MFRTAAELRAELAKAERVEREVAEQNRRELLASWKAVTDQRDSWEWLMTPTTDTDLMTREKRDGLRISCRVKPEVVGEWMKAHDHKTTPNDRDSWWQGMFYYRTSENILTHGGGGTHVLNSEPKLCSDEQWAELVAGRIPDKFRGKWIGGL
jgi:hypothetical protein